MRRYSVAIIISLCILSLTCSNLYAAQVPVDVQQAAQQSLVEYIPAFNADKEHFSLTPTDQIEASSLGEGYPYYKVSVSALNDYESGKSINLSQLYINSGGYIFPIKIGNKEIAIADVEYYKGKWQIVQISSDTGFESDIALSKAKIKESLPQENLPTDIQLIYDQSFGIKALQVPSSKGEYIMPLDNSDSLTLKKGELKPLKDNLDKLHDTYKERVSNDKNIGGTGNITQTKTTSWSWPVVILVLCFVSGGVILIRKKLIDRPAS